MYKTKEEMGKLAYSAPDVCGLYLLFNKERLVYIGVGVNCNARIAAHYRTKDFDDFVIIRCSYEVSNILEKVMIHFLNPELNIRNPMGKR